MKVGNLYAEVLFISYLSEFPPPSFLERAANTGNLHSSAGIPREGSCFTLLSHQMIHQKFSSFLSLKTKIWYKARQGMKGTCPSLCLVGVQWGFGLLSSGVPLLLSLSFFPFQMFMFNSVPELNARRTPCCVVGIHLPPSPWSRSFELFNFGNDISLQSSKIAIYVNHPKTPFANHNVNGLEFPIDFEVRGLSLWLLWVVLFTTI